MHFMIRQAALGAILSAITSAALILAVAQSALIRWDITLAIVCACALVGGLAGLLFGHQFTEWLSDRMKW